MGLVGLMSRATGNLAGLAAGLSGVGSSVLPRDGASVAVVADETPYRYEVLGLKETKKDGLFSDRRFIRRLERIEELPKRSKQALLTIDTYLAGSEKR